MRTGLAVLGALLTTVVWTFDSEVVSAIVQFLRLGSGVELPLRWGVRLAGAAILLGSSYPGIGALKPAYRLGAFGVIGAVAVGGLGVVGPELVGTVAGYLEIGGPVALALAAGLEWRRPGRGKET